MNANEPNSTTEGQYLTPFQRKLLQKNLQADLSEKHKMRLKIMLLVDEGKTQAEICQVLGCSQATARHWMLMARTGQAHDWLSSPIGRPKAASDEYIRRLQELVGESPRAFGYGFKRWTANWLSKHLEKEFGIEVSDRHINRLLKQMGLSNRQQPGETNYHQGDRIAINNLEAISLSELEF
ncbi:MAG: helix-turn-helix domain-containing protein [Cyanosarcina radialis HA8281-LM2]|jgi:transposase|nr:helix-turn-helix domain-containing protein [Cyanosarcina radialis HA8281-LM2]